MFYDVETGKRKIPTDGKCLICNGKPDQQAFGAGFCNPCLDVMRSGDEEALSNRIVWD